MVFADQKLDILAPALFDEPWSEAAAMGGAVWLWLHSSSHRNMPLSGLSALLLPAITSRQFLLASQNGRPVAYISWANLSEEAEHRYLNQHPLLMPEADWNSGDRMWLLDWVAPFGHTSAMANLVLSRLYANRCMRSLYHRGNERGMKIKQFRGRALLPIEADLWFETHPVSMYGEQKA
jgi:cytolysin-activating lysine-acyltransferase